MPEDSTALVADGDASTRAPDRRPRVVVLGGGFGGLNAAKQLGGGELEVVLVDKRNHHLFQPLLYQVATAGLNPGDIAMPIRSILRSYENVEVQLGEARAVDRERREVELDIGTLEYDYLVVATGTRPNYFGPEEWERESTPLKSIEDALELRRKILYAFERAEQADDPEVVEEWLTFVIIGGGPTGVEMAGAIREIAAEVMVRDFRNIQPEEARVVLVDAAPRLLRSYPAELSENARLELEERGVDVWVDAPIEAMGERSVTAGDQRVRTQTIVWAAGVEPMPLIETLETELAESGQVVVDPDLTIREDDRVFVIGDTAHFEHGDEGPLPGLAPVAIQQGKAAAANVEAAAEGEELEPFEYWDRGQMATIGRKAAVAVVGEVPLLRKTRLTGLFAWLAWLFVHLLFLVGFRNKISVMFDWAYSYIAFKRGARLIVGEPGEGRAAPQPPQLPEGEREQWTGGSASDEPSEVSAETSSVDTSSG